MSVVRLIVREILYRKLNFVLGVVSVVVAVGCLVAELTLLRAHDLRTEQIVAAKEAETKARMRKLEDDYRKITKKLGFNAFILPVGERLRDFEEGQAKKTMPDEYARRLANSRIMTVRHLLPILRRRIDWAEKQREIVLVGTRGEVPLLHRAPKKPMMTLVERDTVVVGYDLHRGLGLKPGRRVTLLGHLFTVAHKLPQSDHYWDNNTVWLDLRQAQELLGQEGKINAILALQCFCPERKLLTIRDEISSVLPDTEVHERHTSVIVRAEARQRAAVEASQAVEAEKASRAHLRRERESFAAILVPLVVVGCIVWVGFLAFSNVRERTIEIGILRALGVRRAQVFAIFLGKAVVVGLVGAAIGYAGGAAIGIASGEVPLTEATATPLFAPGRLLLVLLLAPGLSALASWIPALSAAQQDPAVVLMNA